MLIVLASVPPVLAIAAFMAGAPATRSALAGAASALLIAALWFPVPWPEASRALTQWSPLLIEVLLIVLGGIAFAELTRVSGAQGRIADWLKAALGRGVAPILAIVHGVTPLAESLTGFGVGVVIALPLLLALGMPGGRAAVIALLGLCAVPWGSLAPGTLIAAELAGLPFKELGVATAWLSLPVFLAVGALAAWLAADDRRWWAIGAGLASGTVLWAAVLGANLLIGTAPAGAAGAAVTLVVHLTFRRLRGGVLAVPAPVRRALLPHAVLLGGVLTASLGLLALAQAAPGAAALARPLGSPALWLLIASLVAARGLRPRGGGTGAAARIGRSWLGVGPATGLFIVLGVVMAVSGMSEVLASAVARLGEGYLALAPAVAGLGGYITASNTGANAMFAGPQAQMAVALDADVLLVMAGHNVAASLLGMASPARVALAVSLCPEAPDRRAVQRIVLLLGLGIVALLGAVLLLLAGP